VGAVRAAKDRAQGAGRAGDGERVWVVVVVVAAVLLHQD
jgi:hypothetical protein